MRKIVFLSGTRADFGKLKSLIRITQNSEIFQAHIFVTGMHMNRLYGLTVEEIEKSGFDNIYKYINHETTNHMDRTLAKTIDGFSQYVAQIQPDLIVVHGDRPEALAGAIVGSLNNILVSHIEGGEVSGTIDELIRHSISKLSHIHLVANEQAKSRLKQLGEFNNSIFILGSPDLDLMNVDNLPSSDEVKKYYSIDFDDYAVAMFHPITTEFSNIREHARNFVDALLESGENYIIIYPNNDLGSGEILNEYERVKNIPNIKIFPSLRFEYFLRILKDSRFIIGNSSAGIREAPYYNVPTIDVGSRQKNRAKIETIISCDYQVKDILKAIDRIDGLKHNTEDFSEKDYFGKGRSDIRFINLLKSDRFWSIDCQKQFQDRV